MLRVAPPPQWAASSAVGAPGTPVASADEAFLQLRPTRPYFSGEVVCVEATHLGGAHDGGLIYAEVDAPPATTRAPRSSGAVTGASDLSGGKVALRVGASGAKMHMQCLALHVHSFRSSRCTASPTADSGAPGGAQDGAQGGVGMAASPLDAARHPREQWTRRD